MLQALKFIFSQDKSRISVIDSHKDVIVKLKFIGTFQEGEKIDIKNLQIESNNFFTPIKRLLQGDGRETTYAFLNSVIERSFEIIYAYNKSDKVGERLMCKNIIEDMNKAIKGLTNLQKTYKDDKHFYCNIETLIDTINYKIADVKVEPKAENNKKN
jgi:hypothetical protein